MFPCGEPARLHLSRNTAAESVKELAPPDEDRGEVD